MVSFFFETSNLNPHIELKTCLLGLRKPRIPKENLRFRSKDPDSEPRLKRIASLSIFARVLYHGGWLTCQAVFVFQAFGVVFLFLFLFFVSLNDANATNLVMATWSRSGTCTGGFRAVLPCLRDGETDHRLEPRRSGPVILPPFWPVLDWSNH